MEAKAIIELKDVDKAFYGAKALDKMNFILRAGEMRSLIGENGCGKSTMIKIISGFYHHDAGELYINGKKYDHITPIEAMREGIQVIYQDFSLFPNLTVAENILMNKFVESGGNFMNWKQTYELAKKQIEQLNVELDPSALVADITVAQKQIVAICRALIHDAKLIIMDEPTTALTYKEIQALYKIVEGLLEKNISVLFVSHKLDEVATISNKVTVMRNGKNVFDGDTEGMTKEKMIYYMTGREIVYDNYDAKITATEPVLSVKNFSDNKNFYDIAFDLYPNEVLGITGLMGCGRSEIAKALFGLLPYIGDVKIKGKDVKIKNVWTAMENGIGYVPDDRQIEGLHMPRTISENSIVCVLKECLNRVKMLDKKMLKDKEKESLSAMTIAGMAEGKAVQNLSGGNQQKVLLCKWLATKPDVLILNCPTVGVDVGSKSDIHAIIREIAQQGLAVIVISDDIPEIMQTCNRVLMVKNGRISDRIDIKDTTSEDLEALLIKDI